MSSVYEYRNQSAEGDRISNIIYSSNIDPDFFVIFAPSLLRALLEEEARLVISDGQIDSFDNHRLRFNEGQVASLYEDIAPLVRAELSAARERMHTLIESTVAEFARREQLIGSH